MTARSCAAGRSPASESGRYKRAELHARFAKSPCNFGGDFGGAGGVAVDAEGVGDFGAVPRNDFPLHDGHGLLGGFGGIVSERVGVFAGAQCAVWFVAAV